MKPQSSHQLQLSPKEERLAEQLHKLWLICNVGQRKAWIASLPRGDADLLQTYHALLWARGIAPEKTPGDERVDENP